MAVKNGMTTTTPAQMEHLKRFEEKLAQKVANCHVRIQQASKRTPQEQLKRLDERNGEGLGAKKERARLNYKLQSIK